MASTGCFLRSCLAHIPHVLVIVPGFLADNWWGWQESAPQHCSLVEQTCKGIGTVTTKQHRKMEEISAL